jgi:hypothetical protein
MGRVSSETRRTRVARTYGYGDLHYTPWYWRKPPVHQVKWSRIKPYPHSPHPPSPPLTSRVLEPLQVSGVGSVLPAFVIRNPFIFFSIPKFLCRQVVFACSFSSSRSSYILLVSSINFNTHSNTFKILCASPGCF